MRFIRVWNWHNTKQKEGKWIALSAEISYLFGRVRNSKCDCDDGATVTWSLHSIRTLLIINIECTISDEIRLTLTLSVCMRVYVCVCVCIWGVAVWVWAYSCCYQWCTHTFNFNSMFYGHYTVNENKPPKRVHRPWMMVLYCSVLCCALCTVVVCKYGHQIVVAVTFGVKMCNMHGYIVRPFEIVPLPNTQEMKTEFSIGKVEIETCSHAKMCLFKSKTSESALCLACIMAIRQNAEIKLGPPDWIGVRLPPA